MPLISRILSISENELCGKLILLNSSDERVEKKIGQPLLILVNRLLPWEGLGQAVQLLTRQNGISNQVLHPPYQIGTSALSELRIDETLVSDGGMLAG